jgi:hypothetical protein
MSVALAPAEPEQRSDSGATACSGNHGGTLALQTGDSEGPLSGVLSLY